MQLSVATKIVSVDYEQCMNVADSLLKANVPSPKEEVPAMQFSSSEEANFWFFLVAICHQTSPIGEPALAGDVDGMFRRGWDYLLHTFRLAASKDLNLLNPSHWMEMDSTDIRSLFGPRLNQPAERATLVNDLGVKLSRLEWDSILSAGENCNFRVTGRAPNLLNLLSEFQAYSDPVQKKSVFFLALMKNSGIWYYKDEDQLPAPVDYHEMRGHLRLGTVIIEPFLREKVIAGKIISAEEDVAIRFAIRDAIEAISSRLTSSPNALHYFFWNLFRTYCLRDTPRCDGSTFSTLPLTYQIVVNSSGGKDCPFRTFCNSADQLQAINEPMVVTDFY